jgi:hypothetical protein
MLIGRYGLLVLAVGYAATGAVASHAQPIRLAATSGLEPGLWQIREEGHESRKICVSDPGAFVQLRHANMPCSRLVIANQPGTATVHYSCPGAGWGRTTLKVVTPRAVTIDTQGIAGNAPFAFTADARRVGDCAARSASLNEALAKR